MNRGSMVVVGTSDESYDAALCRLPDVYARALRYTDAGMTGAEICAHLGIEAEALEPLLDLARRKLRTELSRT